MQTPSLLQKTIERLRVKHKLNIKVYWESAPRTKDLLGRALEIAHGLNAVDGDFSQCILVYVERKSGSVALITGNDLRRKIRQERLDIVTQQIAEDMRCTWDHNAIALGLMQISRILGST